MNNNSTPAIFFTPSYAPDIDRAVWLRKSIERFYDGPSQHIFAVPHKDKKLFAHKLGNTGIDYVSQEDMVDPMFYPGLIYKIIGKIAKSQLWRFASHEGRPGWIIQQIVKLSCAKHIHNGPVIFLDSDVFFFKPFNLATLKLDQANRTLIRITPETESAKHRKRIERARNFLSLDAGPTEHNYMGSPVIWYADWCKQLQQYIEKTHNKPWQHALFDARFISEYSLYGIFVEEVLKPSNLAINDVPYYHIVWDEESFHGFESYFSPDNPHMDSKICTILQSNMGIDPAKYEHLLYSVINRR